ncbi:hypothetical protein HX867_19820 [Pseudomonas gingeri]|uniref:hypothetical protein n=1 Tax=Pseudomonas gingeri TaxID=117681 RepID=UPI0015A3281F|nr:hypothetical protein [Pseudomonas gingeri]NVZ64353.1 hypothetical protein [Pseudomonas gingeri]NVZ75946.1 hypothetical protein [Pseudomonas gingeri]
MTVDTGFQLAEFIVDHFSSTRVTRVDNIKDRLRVLSGDTYWDAKSLISVTGTRSRPVIPNYRGQELFDGHQIHSAHELKEQQDGLEPRDPAGGLVMVPLK